MPRFIVISSRGDIVANAREIAETIEGTPEVLSFRGTRFDVRPTDIILADTSEPRATTRYLRRRFGDDPPLVAVIDGAWMQEVGNTLADDWADYLFFPFNPDELGILWRKYTTEDEVPELSVDVDGSGRIQVSFPGQIRYQKPVVDRVVLACRHIVDLDVETAFRLRVCLGEAVTNAVLYGSRGKGQVVRVTAEARLEAVRVSVTDEGDGFDHRTVEEPTTEEGIQSETGRGIFLLRQTADSVEFNEKGNTVRIEIRSSLDPVRRIQPLVAEFAHVTGLDCRLELHGESGADVIFDSWSGIGVHGDGARQPPPPAALDVIQSRSLGGEAVLRLTYNRQGGEAAHLLRAWLEAIVESEQRRETLLSRRMQQRRVLSELEIARDLQSRMLPKPELFEDLARVEARCDPALSLGGDFYYLARLPEGRLGVMLGDVSSHGPSAALAMALTLSTIGTAIVGELDPAAVFNKIHGELKQALEWTDMYMTLFYGILHPDGRTLRMANAGHAHVYKVGDGEVERLPALDPPLGLTEHVDFHSEHLQWGDETLLAFTDGLAELEDPVHNPSSTVRRMMGEGRRGPRSLVEALFADSEDEMRLDDRTAVAVAP